jgi:hypothetical protein
MQAAPPPAAQVLPETGETGARAAAGRAATAPPARPVAAPEPVHPTPAERIEAGVRAAPLREPAPLREAAAQPAAATSGPTPDADASAATMNLRRPVIEGSGRTRADVPWLGIGSWLLLCGALFASLVGWPDQTALDRVTSLWSSTPPGASVSHTPVQEEPTPAHGAPLPADQQDWSAMTPGPAHQQEALPPIELAPPIQSAPSAGPADEGPPLPRFKPSVDRVAAKFSNAFFEFGDRLQREGDFDAALHMRRQGTSLNPWKSAGASDL